MVFVMICFTETLTNRIMLKVLAYIICEFTRKVQKAVN